MKNVQRLAALGPAEVVVTDWNPATRHLRGTLTLTFAATGNAPVAEVRDGQFDLLLAP